MTKPLPHKDDVAATPTRPGAPRLSAVEARSLASVEDESLRKVLGELLIASRANQENFQKLEEWFPIQPADSVARAYEGGGVKGIPFQSAVVGMASSGGAWLRGGKGVKIERTAKGVYRLEYGFESEGAFVFPQTSGVSADWSVVVDEKGEEVIVVQVYVAKTGEAFDDNFFFTAFVIGNEGDLLVGPEGPPGPTHKTLYNGKGVPKAELGGVEDFYLDTEAWKIYGPKTEAGWGAGVSIIGPAGPEGPGGKEGKEGTKGATGAAGPPGVWVAKTGGNAGSSTGITQISASEMRGTANGSIGTAGAIGGIAVVAGDVFFQFAGAKTDGLWEVVSAGSGATTWRASRPAGLATSLTVERSLFYVKEGTNGHQYFLCDSAAITLGTTELVFRVIDNRNYGLVEALPTTPTPIKGDRCEFIADPEKGIVWDLVHTGAAEFPWSCKGIALLAVEEGEQKTKKATYQTTGAPSVNYPLSGDYLVAFGCASVRAAIATDTGFIRVGYHSNGELIKEAILRIDANGAEPAFRKLRHTKRTKGQAAQARYKNDAEAAGETVFEGLFIELYPIRVG